MGRRSKSIRSKQGLFQRQGIGKLLPQYRMSSEYTGVNIPSIIALIILTVGELVFFEIKDENNTLVSMTALIPIPIPDSFNVQTGLDAFYEHQQSLHLFRLSSALACLQVEIEPESACFQKLKQLHGLSLS